MLVIRNESASVSRSSALASKATGFPIARIGTKLAVGYRLDEITNDITKTTPASFEPVLDYVVVKVPRFAFEKFAGADPHLTTQMKSVGESMAIGRTFKEAFQKGLRALETGRPGWAVGATPDHDRLPDETPEALRAALRRPTPERVFQLKRAITGGIPLAELHEITGIDPWFLAEMQGLVDAESWYAGRPAESAAAADTLRTMKRMGFSMRSWARCGASPKRESTASAESMATCGLHTRWWIPARGSFRRRRRTCTGATTRKARRLPAGANPS